MFSMLVVFYLETRFARGIGGIILFSFRDIGAYSDIRIGERIDDASSCAVAVALHHHIVCRFEVLYCAIMC